MKVLYFCELYISLFLPTLLFQKSILLNFLQVLAFQYCYVKLIECTYLKKYLDSYLLHTDFKCDFYLVEVKSDFIFCMLMRSRIFPLKDKNFDCLKSTY